MPKRRMTPARKAAIAKWQRAGAQARKAKSSNKIPRSAYHGKMVSGYHLTEPENVDSILKNGFGKNLSTSKGLKNPVWFFQNPPDDATKRRYAMGAPKLSVVQARFPYRKAKKLGRVEAWYIIENKDIKTTKRYGRTWSSASKRVK